MSELPVSPEMVEFAVNVARATHAGKLDWETTADETVLLAALGGSYTAHLRKVMRQDDNYNEYETVELALLKFQDEIFSIDPEMLRDTAFARTAGIGKSASVTLREVWGRALLKAKKVTDELNDVNRLLSMKLAGTPPPAAAPVEEDDDEVPF